MKGKKGASAERRRVDELEAEMQEQRSKAREQAARSEAERQELQREIQRLRSALHADVNAIADAQVASAVDRVSAEYEAELQGLHRRILEAVNYLTTSDGFQFKEKAALHFTDLLGVTYGDFVSGGGRNVYANRYVRRMTAGQRNRDIEGAQQKVHIV